MIKRISYEGHADLNLPPWALGRLQRIAEILLVNSHGKLKVLNQLQDHQQHRLTQRLFNYEREGLKAEYRKSMDATSSEEHRRTPSKTNPIRRFK